MQTPLNCDKCGQHLVSLWPTWRDPAGFTQLTGKQGDIGSPAPINASSIVFRVTDDHVFVHVRCDQCHMGGCDVSMGRETDAPYKKKTLWAYLRDLLA